MGGEVLIVIGVFLALLVMIILVGMAYTSARRGDSHDDYHPEDGE